MNSAAVLMQMPAFATVRSAALAISVIGSFGMTGGHEIAGPGYATILRDKTGGQFLACTLTFSVEPSPELSCECPQSCLVSASTPSGLDRAALAAAGARPCLRSIATYRYREDCCANYRQPDRVPCAHHATHAEERS
jgi:hypothetical protein